MSRLITAAEPLRAFAAMTGFDENDPTLVGAVDALRRLKRKELSPEQADAAVGRLMEAWTKKAAGATRRAIAMPAVSNSFHIAPLREWAQKAGIHEDDRLLIRALKAQEKPDWETNWTSRLEMDIACLAFIEGHFDVKDAWPSQSGRIEGLLQKLEKGDLTEMDVEDLRRVGGEVLRDWQPGYSPAFKKRIESAIRLLDDPTTEKNTEEK